MLAVELVSRGFFARFGFDFQSVTKHRLIEPFLPSAFFIWSLMAQYRFCVCGITAVNHISALSFPPPPTLPLPFHINVRLLMID